MEHSQKIQKLVQDIVHELGEERDNQLLMTASMDTRIFGHGYLDSIGVVHLVSELEEELAGEFGLDIVLADDRAMSRKTSPFRTVRTLCAYIEERLAEEVVS